MCTKKAFTLIELLVVVTIIALLLALMMPALDRAIYQAELAVCGSKVRIIAGGAQFYAMDHRRVYPLRPAIDENFNIRPDYLRVAGLLATEAAVIDMDERPALAPYMKINAALNCPLSEAVDLEVQDSDLPNGQMWMYTNYALWYGFRFAKPKTEVGMRKMGDRFSWGGIKFDVLADDSDSIDVDRWLTSSHPDSDARLSPEVWRNELLTDTGFYTTFSFWAIRGKGNTTRGTVDRNFAHADGSVRRLLALKIDDERLVAVPDRSSTTGWEPPPTPGRRRWLPKAE